MASALPGWCRELCQCTPVSRVFAFADGAVVWEILTLSVAEMVEDVRS